MGRLSAHLALLLLLALLRHPCRAVQVLLLGLQGSWVPRQVPRVLLLQHPLLQMQRVRGPVHQGRGIGQC